LNTVETQVAQFAPAIESASNFTIERLLGGERQLKTISADEFVRAVSFQQEQHKTLSMPGP
jgi:hypothetical protein